VPAIASTGWENDGTVVVKLPEAVVLGRGDPQRSLLETRYARRHLVTKGSFYERLADHGKEIISDDDFAHLYADGKGRPSVPPSVMIRALLCATHDRTSDRETSRRTRVDADWKAAMGVDDDFTGIAATTFSLMRDLQGSADGDHRLLAGARLVHGAGNVADTYELIRKMMGRLARAMGEHLEEASRTEAVALAAAKPDFDWQDPAARRRTTIIPLQPTAVNREVGRSW
jgi:hypothetical protein